MQLLFWLSLSLIVYTYLGYAVIVWLVLQLKGKRKAPLHAKDESFPSLTLVVACYNEAEILEAKIRNTLSLTYPENKL